MTSKAKPNTSGVEGVYPVTLKSRRPSEAPRKAWAATWKETVDGKRKARQRNFYYKPGGEHEAFEKAVAHRKEMERLHY